MNPIIYICESCKEECITFKDGTKLCEVCIAEFVDESIDNLEGFLDKFGKNPCFVALCDLYMRLSPHDIILAGAWQRAQNKNNRRKPVGNGGKDYGK